MSGTADVLDAYPLLVAAMPAAFAIFIWWFSTGLILLLDNLPRTTFRWSLVISSGLALVALAGVERTAGQTSPAAAYCAFTCALLVWGWHELTFLTGWITGPRKRASPPGTRGWARFVHAVQAILWHEIGILAAGALIVVLTWGQPNQVATGTFLVLWAMRTSAKLNLFLGVRNHSEEFLPPHLKYLGSFFRRRAMNVLFPFSIVASSAVAALMIDAALNAALTPGTATGLLLVATMLALGILEHWLLVLPLPATALWRWAMRAPAEGAVAPLPSVDTAKETLLHAR